MKALPRGFGITIVDPNLTICQLYNTRIVEISYRERTLILKTGGWRTMHTKKCMNLILRRFDMGVFQKNFDWYLQLKSRVEPFEEGMVIGFLSRTMTPILPDLRD